MAETFQLEIVTPERLVVNDRAEEMQLPGRNGYLGILPGHAPLITELGVGEISYRNGARTEHLAVASGFAEVLPDRVTILAETAEKAHDIDIPRAERAKQGAEQGLQKSSDDHDVRRCQVKLERAIIRLQVAGKAGARR
jgi:F-type H+-transporting ATPase subunit epsilon